MKLNFWQLFAINTGVSALKALVTLKGLNAQQKEDIQAGLDALQKILSDFS